MSQRPCPNNIVRRHIYSNRTRGLLDTERDQECDSRANLAEIFKKEKAKNPLFRKLSFTRSESENQNKSRMRNTSRERPGPSHTSLPYLQRGSMYENSSPSNKMFFRFMQQPSNNMSSGDDRRSPRKEKEPPAPVVSKKKGFFAKRAAKGTEKRKKNNSLNVFEECSSQDTSPDTCASPESIEHMNSAPAVTGNGGTTWRSASANEQMIAPRPAPRSFTADSVGVWQAGRNNLNASKGSLNGACGADSGSSRGSFESLGSAGRPQRSMSSLGRSPSAVGSTGGGGAATANANTTVSFTGPSTQRARYSIHDSSGRRTCQNFVLQVPEEVFKGRQRRHLRILKLLPSILRTATQLSAQLWEAAFESILMDMAAGPLNAAVLAERRRDANCGLLLEALADDCVGGLVSGQLRHDREAWAGITRGLVIRVATETRQLQLRLRDSDVLTDCADQRVSLVVASVLREMSLRALFNQKLGVRKHAILSMVQPAAASSTTETSSTGTARDPITRRIDDIFNELEVTDVEENITEVDSEHGQLADTDIPEP